MRKHRSGRNAGNGTNTGPGTRAVAPGKMTLTASLPPARRGAVQMRAAPAAPARPVAPASTVESWNNVVFRPDLHAAPIQAKEAPGAPELGTPASSGSPMEPALQESMSQSFGTDFSNVRVHEDSSPSQIGAIAYTSGSDIHFSPGTYNPGSTSGRELIGHELAHVVQQSAGRVSVQGKDSQINTDPSLEAEADAAGVRAARGEPAQVQGAAGGGAQRRAIQCYTEKDAADQGPDDWNAGEKLRISDDGNIAVRQDTQYGSHEMWALPTLIGTANGILQSKKSVIRLSAGGGTLKGDAPDGSGTKTLSSVVPENVATKQKGTGMTIWADCGRSGRDVMGAGKGTGKNYGQMTGVYNKERGRIGSFFGLSPERKTRASSPKAMASEIYSKLGGKAAYDALSPAEKENFDQDAGINRYAAPEIGEGYTMASGGNDYPGEMTWNFHWGGVIMVSGGDRVTLENYATGDPEEKNDEWDFQMYGPAGKAGQTFHDQHKATRQHGDAPTTVRVRKR